MGGGDGSNQLCFPFLSGRWQPGQAGVTSSRPPAKGLCVVTPLLTLTRLTA